MYGNVPVVTRLRDLKQFPQWVCYSHKSKVPLSPHTGKGADCNDPESWGDYDLARKTWASNRGWYAGLGFEFVKEQGLTGIDLDKCIIDGEFTEYALKIIQRLNSYTEFSPSGTGVHIWVRGNIPSNFLGAKDEGPRIEMYDHLKYFTVTGKHVPGTPETMEDRQEELLAIHAEVSAIRTTSKASKQKHRDTEPLFKPSPESPYGTPYGLSALQSELMNMAMAVNGTRNSQLNRSAFALGQLLAGDELRDRAYIERELGAAAQGVGLEDREIENTMRSGLEDGMQEARSAPPSNRSSTWKGYDPQDDMPLEDSGNGHKEPPPQKKKVTEEELCSFTADDAGNGDAMHAIYGEDFLFCHARGWFVYTGTHWELDPSGAHVKKCAVITLRRRRHAAVNLHEENIIKCTKGEESRVNGCVSRFKTLVDVSIEEFDNNPDVINCKNGVVNLQTGNIEPHNKDQRFTYCIPVAYRSDAFCQEWIDYLSGVVGGGQEIIDYLQMAIGYSMTGHTREEILFYLFGPTRSGKGTISEIFMSLMPTPLSTGVDFNSFTARREGDTSNFDLAPLKVSRLIFASESLRGQSLNPAKIKQLTGGDRIRACFKHRDHFEYRPQFKVWMLSNWAVNGDPEDDALWGRVRVIEFPNSFLGKEDKTKKARLREKDALEGILAWAVEGSKRWYGLGSDGLYTPESISATTKKQRADLDYVQQWIDDCCEENEEYWTPNEEISKSYLKWCKGNNVQHTKDPKRLAQSLQTKGYQTGMQKKISGKNRKGVKGLYIYPEGGEEFDGNG